jgi:hypothetical protein
METLEELQAIYAAAHAIQEGAAKAVAELAQLVADNRAIPAQIAQEAMRTKADVPKLVLNSAGQALERIEKGAETAVRKAAVSDVGAKIEAAMVGPMAKINLALEKLEQSASSAQHAASHWKLYTRVFRWQQLAIAVLVGVVIGSAGTWYFASQPLQEAANQILWLEQTSARRTAASPTSGSNKPKPGSGSSQRNKHLGAQAPEVAPPTAPAAPDASAPPDPFFQQPAGGVQ